MLRALVSHRDFFNDCPMAALVVLRAWVDGMPVVDTAACRVALNDLITHDIVEGDVYGLDRIV